jgi:hypothetical protein
MNATLTTAQLKALAIVAPGTLMLSRETFNEAFFHTTTDDAHRSGIWGINVLHNGAVELHKVGGGFDFITLTALQQREREACAECGC